MGTTRKIRKVLGVGELKVSWIFFKSMVLNGAELVDVGFLFHPDLRQVLLSLRFHILHSLISLRNL